MTKKQIFRKTISKACQNGLEPNDIRNALGNFLGKDKYFLLAGLPLKEWFKDDKWKLLIVSPNFAKALGYKLKDLKEWCDSGKNPINYLEKFI